MMLNSKFDICSPEWIERVFENRNKSYGAYDIRKHYASNVLRALGVTVLFLAAVFGGSMLLADNQNDAISVNQIDVTNQNLHVVKEPSPQKRDKLNKSAVSPSLKEPGGKNHSSLNGNHHAVKQTSVVPVSNTDQPLLITSAAKPTEPSNSTLQQQIDVLDNDEVAIKPVLPGGAQQWSKFLESNLRYPAEAKKNRISGKVWMSFIVERDGHVSNVLVERGAGYGFDEEALRVLKLSPVWIPGNHNGQTVRVKYVLPINFHIEH
ncbi:energy transducer TonB [Mucilaginibacter paludis]|uniref:TonB family protein n=1 Tax=Mucilaginibacter paludis DSM 18603 TaxID=714943 RepID=H1YF71_9SPHI|nr:energy transducer TonB [Mucilaginibacter paludis]EHQ26210.1 TonB family protein [Mucilaginibacter paludis DSM 18603]